MGDKLNNFFFLNIFLGSKEGNENVSLSLKLSGEFYGFVIGHHVT